MTALDFSILGGLIGACIGYALFAHSMVRRAREQARHARSIAHEWRNAAIALDAEVKDRIADIMTLSDQLEARRPMRGAGGRWVSRRS